MPHVKEQEPSEEEFFADDDGEDELVDEDEEGDSTPKFELRNRIPGATASNRLMSELLEMIHHGEIDLEPPYQRDVVWTKPKQMAMIESVFSGLYIPPVLFNVIECEDGSEMRICIDGKQRLTSISRFLEGLIPYKDPITKKLWWYTTPDNTKSTRMEIPPDGKKWFATRALTCVEYRGLTVANEREMFQRVQLGVPLTSAEKLQAVASLTAEWIVELDQKYFKLGGGLDEHIKIDDKRGRDFQNLANLVYCCEGVPNERRFATTPKVTAWINRPEGPSKEMKRAVESMMNAFVSIASDKAHNQAFRTIEKKVAPVEFVFIGVLLFQLRHHSKHAQGLAIHSLRTAIRSEFTDVRNNGRTVKALWGYVDQLVEDPLNPVQTAEEVPAVVKKGRPKGKKRTVEEVEGAPVKAKAAKSRKKAVA